MNTDSVGIWERLLSSLKALSRKNKQKYSIGMKSNTVDIRTGIFRIHAYNVAATVTC
jgi:hypothetical protein